MCGPTTIRLRCLHETDNEISVRLRQLFKLISLFPPLSLPLSHTHPHRHKYTQPHNLSLYPSIHVSFYPTPPLFPSLSSSIPLFLSLRPSFSLSLSLSLSSTFSLSLLQAMLLFL